MRKLLLYLLLFLVVDCALKPPRTGYSTPELREFIEDFEADFGVRVNYPVVFVKDFGVEGSPLAIASCSKWINGYRRVEISSEFDDDKQLGPIVYHELGHCSLNIKHYDEKIDIMNTRLSFGVVVNFEIFKDNMFHNFINGVYPISPN